MNVNDAAQEINMAIVEWSKQSKKLVIAIDGYTGVGKTTVLNRLAEVNPNILAVHRDDFILPRKQVEEMMAKAEDKSTVFELEVCDSKKIENLVTAFLADKPYETNIYEPISGEVRIPKTFDTSKKVLIIEGVFLFHPLLLNHLWDKRIYLTGDTEKIDARRVEREKARWGADYFPETHPDSYFRNVIIACKRYQATYKLEQLADLVINIDV